ncbi:hypothetical protein IAU60_002351 [Kwoniella sp. DSM 27419]
MSGPSRINPARRPSLPSDSSESVVSSLDTPKSFSGSSPLIKHGKYVLLGSAACWWSGLPMGVMRVLEMEGGWIRKMMVAGLSLHGVTVFIFLYLVLFLPWLRGYIPNYPKWQQSARLRFIVPLLTLTILLGWTSLVVSLSQAGKRTMLESAVDAVKGLGNASLEQMEGVRGLGVFRSMVGATGLYTLTLGLLGFIPAPVRDKQI